MEVNVFMIAIICGIGFIYCSLTIIPERAHLEPVNPKFIKWGKVYIKRYGRQSGYYIHVEGETILAWNNNVSLHLIFYEFLSNDYRRSFVEMHFKYCDMIKKDLIVGEMLRMQKLTCPLPAGEYHLMNMSVPLGSFNNQFPFAKGRIDIIVNTTQTKENIFTFHLYATFKQK